MDGVVNHPLVIILSMVVAVVITFLSIIFFLEITYFFIAKRRPTTDKFKHRIGKHIVSVPIHLFRVKSNVLGREHLPKDPKFLIYANHTSELDISLLMWHLPNYPVAFLAKQEVGNYLSIGKWSESIGCVMLNRESARQGSHAIEQVKENLLSGSTMVIFPEGGVRRDLEMVHKFRRGAFKVALETDVPIVPVTIVKEADFYKKHWPTSKQMDLTIHEPVRHEEIKDMTTRELADYIKSIIESPFQTKETTQVSFFKDANTFFSSPFSRAIILFECFMILISAKALIRAILIQWKSPRMII